jgi:hypothetical protein
MKLVSKSTFALTLAAAFMTMQIHQASALPMHSFAIESQNIVTPVACKYGSGKCADVKPEHKAPSTVKNGPQDPTVDPDCGHYGNCRGGNPEGGSASAKGASTTGNKGVTTVKTTTVTSKHK